MVEDVKNYEVSQRTVEGFSSFVSQKASAVDKRACQARDFRPSSSASLSEKLRAFDRDMMQKCGSNYHDVKNLAIVFGVCVAVSQASLVGVGALSYGAYKVVKPLFKKKDENSYNVSKKSVQGFASTVSRKVAGIKKRISQQIDSDPFTRKLSEKIRDFDESMVEKHGRKYKFLRNTALVLTAPGLVSNYGLAALAAYGAYRVGRPVVEKLKKESENAPAGKEGGVKTSVTKDSGKKKDVKTAVKTGVNKGGQEANGDASLREKGYTDDEIKLHHQLAQRYGEKSANQIMAAKGHFNATSVLSSEKKAENKKASSELDMKKILDAKRTR